jgi:hypothetical protein
MRYPAIHRVPQPRARRRGLVTGIHIIHICSSQFPPAPRTAHTAAIILSWVNGEPLTVCDCVVRCILHNPSYSIPGCLRCSNLCYCASGHEEPVYTARIFTCYCHTTDMHDVCHTYSNGTRNTHRGTGGGGSSLGKLQASVSRKQLNRSRLAKFCEPNEVICVSSIYSRIITSQRLERMGGECGEQQEPESRRKPIMTQHTGRGVVGSGGHARSTANRGLGRDFHCLTAPCCTAARVLAAVHSLCVLV